MMFLYFYGNLGLDSNLDCWILKSIVVVHRGKTTKTFILQKLMDLTVCSILS